MCCFTHFVNRNSLPNNGVVRNQRDVKEDNLPDDQDGVAKRNEVTNSLLFSDMILAWL